MNTGNHNVKGRIIYQGPRGGLYVIGPSGRKLYKFKKMIRRTQFDNIPLNVQRLIFQIAASGPMQAKKVGAISSVARNATKYKRAAALINKARRKHLKTVTMWGNYNVENIPHRLGRMAERMGENKLAKMYRLRENVKKNFRNRILPKGYTSIEGRNKFFENTHFIYRLERNGVLTRVPKNVPPGYVASRQYIGKV